MKQRAKDGVSALRRPSRASAGRAASAIAVARLSLAAAATYLGLTEAELRTELQAGKTLAQVAKAKDKSVDG